MVDMKKMFRGPLAHPTISVGREVGRVPLNGIFMSIGLLLLAENYFKKVDNS